MSTQSHELQVVKGGVAVPPAPQAQLTAQEVIAQVQLIQKVMDAVMQEGVHYGTIPGCGKRKVLYKAGAEKLSMTFRLIPDIKTEISDHPNGHREYRVVTTLKHAITSATLGQGVGSCSTMEAKYRYRNQAENTGKPVPQIYWKNKNPEMIGGKDFAAKKDENGDWMIFKKAGEKIENPDIADMHNTAWKMAAKRSLIHATITATAASDIFDQDLEENALEVPPETPVEHRELPPGTERVTPAAKQPAPVDTQAEAPSEEGLPPTWRDVRVHWGKHGPSEDRKTLGKKLGELDNRTLHWFFSKWMPEKKANKKYPPKEEDNILMLALTEWRKEQNAKNEQGVQDSPTYENQTAGAK
ncbi:MAG: hypothetical protein PHV34_05930 [Verrucomicrobiae bacterium]|nr:hypothetical protein [Verrucomicrobiae bacterium]